MRSGSTTSTTANTIATDRIRTGRSESLATDQANIGPASTPGGASATPTRTSSGPSDATAGNADSGARAAIPSTSASTSTGSILMPVPREVSPEQPAPGNRH